MSNLLDVYDASELFVYVGEYDGDAWNYERIEFRRNVDPEIPNNDRAVYDGLDFKGTKPQRSENTLTIEEEFQGWGEGLFAYENTSGLLVKIVIEPSEGAEAPTDDTRYYTNWCPESASWSAGDEGEINVTLEGRFNEKLEEEPEDDSDF